MTAFKDYLIGILLVLTIFFGFLTDKYMTEVAAVREVVNKVAEINGRNVEQITQLQQSCINTQEVTNRVVQEREDMQQRMNQDLERLAKLKDKPEVQRDESKEQPTAFSDSGRISPELNQLLNSAYCNAVRNDSSCSTK